MANGDISNQLSGVSEGLDRFLEALDASSMGLGSQDALKKIQARAEMKRLDQEKRFKAKIEKMEKTHLKQLTESIKSMKMFNKNMGDMAKKGLGKGMSMLKGAGKAGLLGAAVVAIKFLVDGMLKIDGSMAKLVKGTGRLRDGLAPTQKIVNDISTKMSYMGVNMEQVGTEVVNLSQHFGQMSRVTGDIVELSLQMQQAFGMAATETGQMIESLTRINVDAREFVETMRKDAVMAGTNVSLVMRNVATIAKDISIQNSRSVESFKAMAIEAAVAGVNASELVKTADAFMDPQVIGENIGKVAQRLGGDFAKMNPFTLWNLADQPGKIEDLNNMVLGAMNKQLSLDKEGNLINERGALLRRSDLKAMSQMIGMSEEALVRVLKQRETYEGVSKELADSMQSWNEIVDAAREQANIEAEGREDAEKYAKLRHKQLIAEMKGNQKINKEVKARIDARRQEANLDNAMNETIQQSQTILQRLQYIASGVFNDITTEISKLFGFESNKEGGLRATIEGFSTWLKSKLNMAEFAKEVKGEDGEATFEEAFEAIKNRLLPIFADIGKEFGKLLAAGLSDSITEWKRNNAWADWLLPDTEKENLLEELEDLQTGMAGEWHSTWGTQALNASLGIGREETAARIKEIEKQLGLEPETKLAKGGLVTRPTRALIGEAGPELVLPLGGGAKRILPLSGTQRFADGGDIIPLSSSMFTGITTSGGGLMGSGSEARRSQVGAANMAESKRQQEAAMNYWRKEYDRRLDEMEERDKNNKKSWQDYAKQFFLKYEKEVGVALGKALGPLGPAGKEISSALMTGMKAWSSGKSAKEALSLGVRAGLNEAMKEGGTMDKFFKRHDNVLLTGLQEGLQTFARTGSLKQAGRSLVAGGARAIAKKYLGDDAMGVAAQYMGQAASGRVVNRPGLFMAGEGGNREVIVPTDRIRKGLPINSSVAHELGSIGVPGFKNGGSPSAYQRFQKTSSVARGYAGGKFDQDKFWTNRVAQQRSDAMSGLSLGGKAGFRFEEMGGLGGMAKAGGAGALMSFADTFQRTGNWGQAATAGVGSGAGVGIGMGLTAVGVPPPLSTMAGQFAGQLITKGLNKAFGLTGGYGKGRRRAAKSIEQHIKSGGLFDFGQPSGLGQNINLAIGGREKTPTEPNYQKLVDRLNKIKGLARAGVDAGTMIALGTGKITGPQAMDAYKKMNTALYGSAAGDKYMKAVAQPQVQLASGGIVTRPTTALVGESGPEMVIPLHEQRQANENLVKEMKEQNKLMKLMIQTQKDTAGTEIIMDGRKVAETVSNNFYDIGNGI